MYLSGVSLGKINFKYNNLGQVRQPFARLKSLNCDTVSFSGEATNSFKIEDERETQAGKLQFGTTTISGKPWTMLHVEGTTQKAIVIKKDDKNRKCLAVQIKNNTGFSAENGGKPVITLPDLKRDNSNENAKYVTTPGAIDETLSYQKGQPQDLPEDGSITYVPISQLRSLIEGAGEENANYAVDAPLIAMLFNHPDLCKDTKPLDDDIINDIQKAQNTDVETPKDLITSKFLNLRQGNGAIYAHRPLKDGAKKQDVVSITTVVRNKEDGKLYYVMLEENRPPIMERYSSSTPNPTVLASPAGLMDEEDKKAYTAESACLRKTSARELQEETGIEVTPGDVGILASNIPSSSQYTSEDFTSSFVLTDVPKIEGKQDDNDVINVEPKNTDGGVTEAIKYIPVDKMDDIIKSGKYLVNTQTMAGLALMNMKFASKDKKTCNENLQAEFERKDNEEAEENEFERIARLDVDKKDSAGVKVHKPGNKIILTEAQQQRMKDRTSDGDEDGGMKIYCPPKKPSKA